MAINQEQSANLRGKPVTLEVMVYSAILILAILFRFVMLGDQGLSDREALNALQAYDLSAGQTVAIGSEPAYVGLTGTLFSIFEPNNYWARFWPAVFGSLLVLVPILFRNTLGKVTALILAALVAIDPAMISLARSAGSAIIGITALFACIGFLLNRKPILASICGGITLLGGASIWPGFLVLGLVFFGLRTSWTKSTDEMPENSIRPGWKRLILPGLVTVLVISSQFFIHINSISGIGGSLAGYFKSWSGDVTTSLGHYFVMVFWLQLPLLLLGFASIIIGLLSRERKTWFLGVWWALALLIAAINPTRSAADLGWSTIPLLVLTAILLTTLIKNLQFDNRLIALVQAVFTFLMVILSFYYLINITNAPEIDPLLYRNKVIGAVLPIVLLTVITILFTWGWNTSSGKTSLVLSLTMIGLVMIFSNGWKATGWTSPAHAELWSGGPVVIGDELLRNNVNDLGRWSSGQANSIGVEIVGLESPSLRWALKATEVLILSNQANQKTTSAVVVTPGETPLTTETSYRGEKLVWSTTPELQSMNIWNWIKWTVFRNPPMKDQVITFWARNDLFKTTTP